MGKLIVFRMVSKINSYAFPNRCVYCGKPVKEVLDKELSYSRNLRRYTTTGLDKVTESANVVVKLPIPFCQEHLGLAERAKPILAGVLVLGFIIGLVIAIGFVALVLKVAGFTAGDELATWLNWLLLLGGIAGFALGLWLTKLTAAKLFGPYLKDLSLWSIFSQGDNANELHTLGLVVNAPIQATSKHISFRFTNEDIAEEFRQLNTAHRN